MKNHKEHKESQAVEEVAEPLTICYECGCPITDEDEAREIDGEIYCQDCVDDNFVVCDHCGEYVDADDAHGDENSSYCERCYERYYTRCEHCNAIVHNDSASYDDYDNPYCERCYDDYVHHEDDEDYNIHDYGYKPEPIFYGEVGDNTRLRYFGVELEIDKGGKSDYNAEELLNLANRNNEHIYIKGDGSLNDGLEIVTHPMTLDYHKSAMSWEDVMGKARRLGYSSHKTETCGLHVHVNRDSFADDHDEQEVYISRVLYFVESHWTELLKFSRRSAYQMNRWAARYGYKDKPKDILENAKYGGIGRYACVNLQNKHTIEFRMFRGTLKYNTLIAALKLVNTILRRSFVYVGRETVGVGLERFCSVALSE